MTLREWFDEQTLTEETVRLKGREFLVVELDLAERGRLLAGVTNGKPLTDEMVEGVLLSRCVLDPETREQLVKTEEWELWRQKGSSFSPLLAAVLRVNGLKNDEVDDEVKNLETTPS